MWRASMPYGRKGLAVHALSAVDLALCATQQQPGFFPASAFPAKLLASALCSVRRRCCAGDLLAKLRGEPVYGESATAFRDTMS